MPARYDTNDQAPAVEILVRLAGREYTLRFVGTHWFDLKTILSGNDGVCRRKFMQFCEKEIRMSQLKHSERLNAAQGAVIGALVGDAAGSTLEFMGRKPTSSEVENAMRMVGGGIHRTAPGQVTDDGELTIALAHSLSGATQYDPNRAAHFYRKWYLSHPFDVGNATTAALGRGDLDSPTLADEVMRNALRYNAGSKANGSLMRASALGVWSAKVSLPDAVKAAQMDAQMTHPNPSCQWAGAAYVVAIRHLILNPCDAQGAFLAAEEALVGTDAEEVRCWLSDARQGALPEFHPMAGFVRVGFTHAFHHLIRNSSYTDALFATLLGGGDTDTNACIVGGLMGALHGFSSLPKAMGNAITMCDTSKGRPRPDWLHTTQIDTLIGQLLCACTVVGARMIGLHGRIMLVHPCTYMRHGQHDTNSQIDYD